METRIYQFPPITEAIIGVTFEAAVSDSDLDDLQKKFARHYPHHQPMSGINLAFKVDFGPQGQTANTDLTSRQFHRRSNADQTELLILKPDSAIFSQLAPYPGWDYFYARFVRDWKIIKRALGFKPIHHIGVRYINRIDIPTDPDSEVVEHEDYLRVYPAMPSQFGSLTAYAVQAELEMEDINCILRINSAAVPSPMIECASFVVDIDVVRQSEVPQKDEDIFELLQKIRARKNEIFEAAVTNNARRLFGHGT